jgi:hypothetical protein
LPSDCGYIGLSGGTPDMFGAPSHPLPANMVGVDHGADHCASWELLSAWHTGHVRYTPYYPVNYSQRPDESPIVASLGLEMS